MKQFKDDIIHWKDYDYTVINDKVEKCYKLIIKFIDMQKKTKKNLNYNKKFIKKHVEYLTN